MWVGEFFEALFHQHVFEFAEVDLGVDLIEDFLRRELIDSSREVGARIAKRLGLDTQPRWPLRRDN